MRRGFRARLLKQEHALPHQSNNDHRGGRLTVATRASLSLLADKRSIGSTQVEVTGTKEP